MRPVFIECKSYSAEPYGFIGTRARRRSTYILKVIGCTAGCLAEALTDIFPGLVGVARDVAICVVNGRRPTVVAGSVALVYTFSRTLERAGN